MLSDERGPMDVGVTLGVVRALRERLGHDWADQIAVVSFDHLDWFEFASPPIRAVRK